MEQKAHANIRLTMQSIFCVIKKATFAIGLVQIAEFQQKINRSRSTTHLDQPGSHVTVYAMVNLKTCSYKLAYVYLTSTEVSSRSIVGTKPAKLQHVLYWLSSDLKSLVSLVPDRFKVVRFCRKCVCSQCNFLLQHQNFKCYFSKSKFYDVFK